MILADDLISAGLLDVHHTDPVEIELSMLTKMIERAGPSESPRRRNDHRRGSAVQSTAESAATRITSVKFVIAGGFGVGKTVRRCDLRDRAAAHRGRHDERLDRHRRPAPHRGQDHHHGRHGLRPHHVDDTLVMYLFGTPGQDRFGFMWDDICLGASAP